MFGWFKRDDWERIKRDNENKLREVVRYHEKRMYENEEKLIEKSKLGEMEKTESILHALIIDLLVKTEEGEEKIRVIRHSWKYAESFFIVEKDSWFWSESLTGGFPSRTWQNVPITVQISTILDWGEIGKLEVLNMITIKD